MGAWDRLRRASRRLLGGEAAASGPAPEPSSDEPPQAGTSEETGRARGITSWVEERAQRAVQRAYETHAGDLEERALRVVSSVYERTADDLEERAVRAMRRTIEAEAGRIERAIEHGIAVKRREVRLSLLVLIVSSLVYLALDWFTHRQAS